MNNCKQKKFKSPSLSKKMSTQRRILSPNGIGEGHYLEKRELKKN